MRNETGRRLIVGLLMGAAFEVLNFGGSFTNVVQIGAAKTALQVGGSVNQASDESDYIALTHDQIAKLNAYRSKLDGPWVDVNEQKRILDAEVNPGIDQILRQIYGPSYGTPQLHIKGTPEQTEAADKKFRESPFYAKTRKLQEELAHIETETLRLATEVNNFQRGMMDENPARYLIQQ